MGVKMTDNKKIVQKKETVQKRIEKTSGIRNKAENSDRCIHCGSLLDPISSSASHYGICQNCIDD